MNAPVHCICLSSTCAMPREAQACAGTVLHSVWGAVPVPCNLASARVVTTTEVDDCVNIHPLSLHWSLQATCLHFHWKDVAARRAARCRSVMRSRGMAAVRDSGTMARQMGGPRPAGSCCGVQACLAHLGTRRACGRCSGVYNKQGIATTSPYILPLPPPLTRI